jgi:hypothetical protein
MPQELRHDQDHDPLKDPGPDERGLITPALNRPGDERNEERRPPAEPGGNQPGGETPILREPLERRAHAAAVDEGGANAGDHVEHAQHGERIHQPETGPANSAEDTGNRREDSRAETVYEKALSRLHPGLEEDEEREGRLDF